MPAGLLVFRVLELRDGTSTDEREELGARVDATHDVGARPEAAEDLVGWGPSVRGETVGYGRPFIGGARRYVRRNSRVANCNARGFEA